MKSIFITLLVCLTVFVALSLFSCGKKKGNPEPETEKPKVEGVTVFPASVTDMICGQPDPRVIPLSSSEKFKLDFTLKSKEGLSQYKIDLHHNFDCHSHRLESVGTVWKLIKIVNLSGNEATIREELTVPDDVMAGNYHFMLQAVDMKGNEATFELYTLKIHNIGDRETPVLSVKVPASDSISIKNTDKVLFDLEVSDNNPLKGGKIEVSYFDPSHTEFTVDQYFFSDTIGNKARYQYSYEFPFTPSQGNHVFVIRAFDVVGNVGEKHVIVHVGN